jgi:hypothetical protein
MLLVLLAGRLEEPNAGKVIFPRNTVERQPSIGVRRPPRGPEKASRAEAGPRRRGDSKQKHRGPACEGGSAALVEEAVRNLFGVI